MSGTRKLNLDRKDWEDHISKTVRLGGSGTRFIYWFGPTDVDPRGRRKQVFDIMHEHFKKGRVHLVQRDAGGGYEYIAEVR